MEDGSTTAYILYIHIEKREDVIVDYSHFLKINLVLKWARYSQALLAELNANVSNES